MLAHPTHERLIALGLPGMAKAFEDQRRSPDIAALSFEERLGLMVDREAAERDAKRLATRLKFAALRQNAVVEDVDLRTRAASTARSSKSSPRGSWIDRAEGLLITGPTGVGKSWDRLRARPQRLRARTHALDGASLSGFRNTTASGGSESTTECCWPCQGVGSELRPAAFPRLAPPNEAAPLFKSSR